MKCKIIYKVIFDVWDEVDLKELLNKCPDAELEHILKKKIRTTYPLNYVVFNFGEISENVFCKVRVYQVGAIAVTLEINKEISKLEDLIKYSKDTVSLFRLAYDYFKRVRDRLEDLKVVKKYKYKFLKGRDYVDYDDYVIFFINSDPKSLNLDSKLTAGILKGEDRYWQLSEREVKEELSFQYSYYDDEKIFIGYEASLIISRSYSEILEYVYIIEYLLVRLLELDVYYFILDEFTDNIIEDMRKLSSSINLFKIRKLVDQMIDIKVDISDAIEKTKSFTVYFGEVYQAEFYQILCKRFLVEDREILIKEKLNLLGNLLDELRNRIINQLFLILETTIVLLFILEIVLPLLGVE